MADVLAALGLERLELRPGCGRLGPGQALDTGTSRQWAGAEVLELTSNRLSVFRAWLGWDEQPTQAWPALPPDLPPDLPVPADRALLRELCADYLFRGRPLPAPWLAAVEAALGPFPLRVLAWETLVIEAGARLALTGPPTLVLVEGLDLAPGGFCEIRCPARMAVGRPQRLHGAA